jgi:hypothetical protein
MKKKATSQRCLRLMVWFFNMKSGDYVKGKGSLPRILLLGWWCQSWDEELWKLQAWLSKLLPSSAHKGEIIVLAKMMEPSEFEPTAVSSKLWCSNLLGCNSVVLLMWTTLRICLAMCDFECRTIKSFNFSRWTPFNFQMRR